MDPILDDSCWKFIGDALIDGGDDGGIHSLGFSWPSNLSDGGAEFDFLGGGVTVASEEKECTRKRARNESCSRPTSKACREKLRRERLKDGFRDLSIALESGRPAKTDKAAILDDAIKVLNQLRNEAQELKETNEKLVEEVKILKAEKNELREEKTILKADKERVDQQLKAMSIPSNGVMASHIPSAYHHPHHFAGNKTAVFPSYGLMPMWQYLPPSSCDTSNDHQLRPPAA